MLSNIGNPKELTSRFGAYYVLTVACELRGEEQVSAVVMSLSPSARITYSLAGTIKFELPISEVSFAVARSLKETQHSVKRDLAQCQKRPSTVSKET